MPNQLEARVLPYNDLIDKLKNELKATTEKDGERNEEKLRRPMEQMEIEQMKNNIKKNF